MSTVVLQVGQCGNQLGQQFWDVVSQQAQNQTSKKNIPNSVAFADRYVYTHYDGKYRSVNVDAEPKVVRRLLKENKRTNHRSSNIILGKRGCGANWAMGYHRHRPDGQGMVTDTMEALRKEIERCDCFSGVAMFHSLSGGTGSGLGSRLVECIRDDYPMNFILSCVVAPHNSGESPLQNYNALLCAAHLQRFCDGIVLFRNDDVLYQLEKQMKMASGGTVSFAQMNEHLVECLAGMLLPIEQLTPSSGTSIGMEPWELIRSVSPIPSTRFLTANHVTWSAATALGKLSWDGMMKTMYRSYKRYDDDAKPFASLSSLMIGRGDRDGSFLGNVDAYRERVKQLYNCVSWNPFPVDVWIGKTCPLGVKNTACLTSVANSSDVSAYLNHVIQRAKVKYDTEAYLHWFWKYGSCEEEFNAAFETLNCVVDDYNTAVR